MNANAKKRYEEIKFPFICPITNRKFDSSRGLSIYVTKSLKIDHSLYYDEYVNHRDSSCFFCGSKGTFISIPRGYRNLCNNEECLKKSFGSNSVEGFMYRNFCSREDAQNLFEIENIRKTEEVIKTQKRLRGEDPLWDKRRSRNCIEFWLNKGLTKEEAEIKVKEVMKEIHEKTSLKIRSNPEKYASKFPNKIEYYLKRGYSEEYAVSKISEIQATFSLKICIEKHGKEKGQIIWLDRQERWMKTIHKNGNLKGGFSKISQVLFYEIIGLYENKKDISDVFFWTKNKEYSLKNNTSIFLYDFVDLKKRKIIEYNGDQYHANPKIYTSDEMPHPYHKTTNFSAAKIWEKDKIKLDLARKNGFDVLVIWDSEYRKNKQQTLEKCIQFING